MRGWKFLAAFIAATCALAPAQAEQPGEPLYNRLPDLSCQNWNAQRRGGDAALMQQLAGVWEADTMIPGVAGLYDATPEHVVVTQWASGQMTYEKSACFAPYGMQPTCAKSIGHGEWFAYRAQNGWIFTATAVTGSGYHGDMLAPNCGGGFARLIGPDTSESQRGGTATRTGPAP